MKTNIRTRKKFFYKKGTHATIDDLDSLILSLPVKTNKKGTSIFTTDVEIVLRY